MPNDIAKVWEQIEPLMIQMERQQSARQMRNEVHADWLNNFMERMNLKEQGNYGDPTINKSTGIRHTVESMVDDLRARVGLDSLEKKAGVDSVRVILNKLRSYDTDDSGKTCNWPGLEILSSAESKSLISALQSVKESREKKATIQLSAGKALGTALKKLRTYQSGQGQNCAWAELEELSDKEINVLSEELEKNAGAKKDDKDPEELIHELQEFVVGLLRETHGHAVIPSIINKIKDDNRFGQELVLNLGRENLENLCEQLRDQYGEADITEGLPKSTKGPVPIRSRHQIDRDDANTRMFGHTDPKRVY